MRDRVDLAAAQQFGCHPAHQPARASLLAEAGLIGMTDIGTLEPADPFDKSPRGDHVPKFTGLRTAEDLTYVAYENGEFPELPAGGPSVASAYREALEWAESAGRAATT